MNFDLSDEQSLLKEAADRWSADHRGLAKGTAAPDAAWREMAELGWLSLGFDPEFGGLGEGDVETILLGEAFGANLVRTPFYSTVVLCGALLSHLGSAAQKARFLPAIMAGEAVFAFAGAEPARRYALDAATTVARAAGNGFVLCGEKQMVFDAAAADHFIVSAVVEGERGTRLFIVGSAADGVDSCPYTTTDGGQASDLILRDVAVTPDALLGNGDALAAIEMAADRALAAWCADAVGAMDHLLRTTSEYLQTRRQFGVPIGKFQVLAHRMADLLVELELARSMAIFATLSLGAAEPERKRAISQAKQQIIHAARCIGRQAIQMHGGMGMTNEFHVGHYFKRLLVFETRFGDASYHADRVEALAA